MINNWPTPLTLIDIRSFLGLARYYKIFVDVFASISYPLTTLTQNKVMFEWSEACEWGFQEFKDKLNCIAVLCFSEGAQGFVVYCEAFQVGLGCVLMKHGKMIVYASTTKCTWEEPSNSCELEVIVFDFKIWRHYMYGVHVNVFADHKSLQYMFTKKKLNLQQKR